MTSSTSSGDGDASRVEVHARVLLLHTGGSLWVDAIGMQGARVEPLVQWLPTSDRTELGSVAPALAALPCFRDAQRLSHLVVALSPGEVPAGDSAQLAVALAALWYWRASRRGLPCTRPHGAPVRVRRILGATGRLVERAGEDGLYRYVIGAVDGIDAKVAALARRAGEVDRLHLVVPEAQEADATAAIARHLPEWQASAVPRTWRLAQRRLHLHPVGDLDDLQDVVDLILAEASLSAASPELEIGTRLEDRFVLRALIGEGGAGSVWRADDTLDGGAVAVKVLHPHIARDPERLAAFYRGARHMEQLAGPGVARVIHSPGGHGPHRYIVVALLPGGSLRDAAGRVGLEVVLEVADALASAHAAGIVHRDVKPQNVLLDEEGHPVLVDFDLARVLDSGGATTRSVGTLAYCAPEVLAGGAGAASPASDVYALAMTAMFVLYGADLPVAALRGPQDFLERVDAPSPIRWALAEALATDPDRRPADAGALAKALRQAIDAGQSGPPYRGSGRARRWPLRIAAAATVLTALVAAWSWVGYQRATQDAGDAREGAQREKLAERAWRIADTRPGEALALLRATDRLDAAGASRLLWAGASSFVLDTPDKVLAVDVAPDGAIGVGTMGGHLLVFDAATGDTRWHATTSLERAKAVQFAGGMLAAWAPDAGLRGNHDVRVAFHDAATGEPADGPLISGSPELVTFGAAHALSRAGDTLLFWDLAAGLPVREVRLAPGEGAYLSPDGRTALLSGPDGDRLIRAGGTVAEVRRPPRPDLRQLAWSADGSRFVRASAEVLVLFDAESLEPLVEVPIACHRRLFVDARGERALCGGSGTEVSLVTLDTAQAVALEGHAARLSVGAFLRDAVITGAFDGGLRVWDSTTGAPLASLAGHTALVGAIVPLDEHRFVTGGQDATVRIWDLSGLWPHHEVVARDVRGDLALHGTHVAWRGGDGNLYVDDRRLGPIAIDDRLSWSTGGAKVVSAGGDSAVWSLDGTRQVVGEAYAAAAVEVGQEVRIALVTPDGYVAIGPAGGDLVKAPRRTETLIQGLAWASPEVLLVFPYSGPALALRTDGTPVSRMEGLAAGVTDHLVRDGLLVAGTWSAQAGIWDIDSGELRTALAGHDQEVVAVDLSPDAQRVATGSWDGTARIWDAQTGEALVTLQPGGGAVGDVAFSPDGLQLATLSRDRRTRVYDVRDGQLLAVHAASRAIGFAWDAQGLLTVELDGTVRRWTPPQQPAAGWSAYAGARSNLRLCPGSDRVVRVHPWPDAASVDAPRAACDAVRAQDTEAPR